MSSQKDRLRIALAQVHTPAYSPHLAPSDFHLFPTLQEFLCGRRFTSDEVKDDVKAWLNGLAAEGYDAGIQRLVTGCDKCLKCWW
jgi:hypothetical protein